MIVPLEKPGTPQELVHFGVKGMKWGVRNEEENGSEKVSISSKPKQVKLDKQTKARVSAHTKNVVNKVESSDHKLTPEQKKKIAYTIAGTVAVGAIVGGAYYLNRKHNLNLKNLAEKVERDRTEAAFSNRQKFFDKYLESISRADGSITKLSYDRPAMTFPSGHTFHRYSTGAERSFGDITYATASKDDFNRYAAYFGDPRLHKFAHQVDFKSTKALKVPKLDTVLDTLQEITGESRESSVKLYSDFSGGKWDDPRARKLFASLKNKGYSALIDENDAGFLSDKPLLIFDHSGLGKKVSRKLTPNELLQAMGSVKDFTRK